MSGTEPIAHVRQKPDGEWETHSLCDHGEVVSQRAADFAIGFGGAEWARLAGLWHDLGKYNPQFQRYIGKASGYNPEAHLEGDASRPDHSTAGAIHAVEKLGMAGRIPAYLIAGHHAGLPDWNSPEEGRASLFQRMEGGKQNLQAALAGQPLQTILQQSLPASMPPQGSLALWIRMLFSCLVDADFLDTEAFMDGGKAEKRGGYTALGELLALFDRYMADMAAKAADGDVNRIRADVLRQCREKAALPSGLFSLTVPTGGGKTLSSMAFALNHAMCHGKRRVIYVIPYTSIIEQTAEIFRRIFGDDNVIEHHSNLDPDKEDSRARLAAENWDAPIIVTTNVQFFESLFAAKSSRCRKLHNIVNSVVVLDEAQLLPPEFLDPILLTMRDLAKGYGVSFVLSTATQPAFMPCPKFKGLEDVYELMGDPDALYASLERVNVRLPEPGSGRTGWAAIAEELCRYDSVLCIVNSRADCRELHRLMPEGAIHLSALMCGEHRSRVIAGIKQRLKDGIPTRVISTQLVEAGVDMDFPVVYRAMAGLDAVAQAAGRCNREGRLDGKGQVIVFEPPKDAAPGLLLKAQQSGREIMRLAQGNPLTRAQFEKYFCHYYASLISLDGKGIVEQLDMKHVGTSVARASRCEFNFRTAASNFRLIEEEGQKPVIVRYGESESLVAALAAGNNMEPHKRREILRKLQRYTVTVRERDCGTLQRKGDVMEIFPGVYVQSTSGLYDDTLGLVMDGLLEPGSLAI